MMMRLSEAYQISPVLIQPGLTSGYAISASPNYQGIGVLTRLDALNFIVKKIMAEDANLLRELATR